MADIARFKELVIGKKVIFRNTALHTFTATYKWKQMCVDGVPLHHHVVMLQSCRAPFWKAK